MTGQNVRIHRWGPNFLKDKSFRLLDTTLRDGIQASGIRQPTLAEKKKIIDFDAKVGIEEIDICIPGVGGRYYQQGVACARYINKNYPHIEIVVLARTIENDVKATIRFAKEANAPITVILFRGSSDLRLIAEDWSENQIVEDMYRFTKILSENRLKVICASEDTTRTRPGFLRRIFFAGKKAGAKGFCIADTVGFADPYSVEAQTRWIKEQIVKKENLEIQFHGHDDTGQSITNSLASLKGGANVIHITWLGIGERAGNTALESLLSAFDTYNIQKYNLLHVREGAKFVSRVFNRPIAVDHSLIGKHVFTTSSGIHAAGIHKAEQKGLIDIAGIVYSAVSPSKVGREHKINIGPLSGLHNVRRVLEKLEISYTSYTSKVLLITAKRLNRELKKREIIEIVKTIKTR